MWPGRVSNPRPLTYESGALPTALRDPAFRERGGGVEGGIRKRCRPSFDAAKAASDQGLHYVCLHNFYAGYN